MISCVSMWPPPIRYVTNLLFCSLCMRALATCACMCGMTCTTPPSTRRLLVGKYSRTYFCMVVVVVTIFVKSRWGGKKKNHKLFRQQQQQQPITSVYSSKVYRGTYIHITDNKKECWRDSVGRGCVGTPSPIPASVKDPIPRDS